MIHHLLHTFQTKIKTMFSPPTLQGIEAKKYLREQLLSAKPCMIARFGSVEIQAVVNGMTFFPFNLILRKRVYRTLINNAGFFPVTEATVKQFSHIMRESMRLCDSLGSWRVEELLFGHELKDTQRIILNTLSPENGEVWLSALAGKKVLVIHPMSELIELQYASSRTDIWPGTNILPEYAKLSTIKAVNSIGGDCDFPSWFDALDWMKQEIDKADFDVALLGCGSYGFPLAAYIKSKGKKAVHIGGALQLLFGIKGKRWEGMPFINEFWVTPRLEDRPKNFERVEGGCYW